MPLKSYPSNISRIYKIIFNMILFPILNYLAYIENKKIKPILASKIYVSLTATPKNFWNEGKCR